MSINYNELRKRKENYNEVEQIAGAVHNATEAYIETLEAYYQGLNKILPNLPEGKIKEGLRGYIHNLEEVRLSLANNSGITTLEKMFGENLLKLLEGDKKNAD